ncbi:MULTISPECIES: tyrosine-type recombinase/integrase [Pseudofrankia]|uniref:tyrosine-type recombinase/integrase n=1 Tax=Pseudofrankia TaxID=2994363 RepID=UPI000234C432|nr:MULTISPECIES: tyrosine-type recombinase/integrase [Pseudofrankia]OHV28659.1 hypothetical protein BCD49_37720 [Pseudofrankia sp. EUN1h]
MALLNTPGTLLPTGFNAGVPVETIRKRLGHADIRSTLIYAHKTDQAADADIRAWRRRRTSSRTTTQNRS